MGCIGRLLGVPVPMVSSSGLPQRDNPWVQWKFCPSYWARQHMALSLTEHTTRPDCHSSRERIYCMYLCINRPVVCSCLQGQQERRLPGFDAQGRYMYGRIYIFLYIEMQRIYKQYTDGSLFKRIKKCW